MRMIVVCARSRRERSGRSSDSIAEVPRDRSDCSYEALFRIGCGNGASVLRVLVLFRSVIR